MSLFAKSSSGRCSVKAVIGGAAGAAGAAAAVAVDVVVVVGGVSAT